jgi:hypothetical protein
MSTGRFIMRGFASQGHRAASRALADQGVSILRDPNAGWIAGPQQRHWIAGPQNRLWRAETQKRHWTGEAK